MAAVDRGERRGVVAERFSVSIPTITRWVRRRRQTGGLAATPVPGPPAVKTAALMAALPARLAQRADATLTEQCAWWREHSGGAGQHRDDESRHRAAGVDPGKKSLTASERSEPARCGPGARRWPRSGGRIWSS